MTPLWTRADTTVTGRIADVVLVAFHLGPLRDDVTMSMARFGLPGRDHLSLLDVREHAGEAALAWLEGFRRGALRKIATSDLADLTALDAADRCVTVRATVADPVDLGYLQAAWAVARFLCARGASIVLDARAMRFGAAETIAAVPADAPFDVRREINVVVESDASRGLGGHVVHTRGLLKVARPEVVSVVAKEDLNLATEVIWSLAARLADGYMPAAQAVVEGSPELHLVPAPGGNFSEALNLDNEAWLLVGADGGAPVWRR